MNIKPLADRVLILPAPAEEKTIGGIIIPDTAKEKPLKGEVIALCHQPSTPFLRLLFRCLLQ